MRVNLIAVQAVMGRDDPPWEECVVAASKTVDSEEIISAIVEVKVETNA